MKKTSALRKQFTATKKPKDKIKKSITSPQAQKTHKSLSESRFRNIFENSKDGIIFFDGKTRKILFGNSAMAELLGCSKEDLVGRSISSLHPSEEWKSVEQEFQKHVSGQTSLSSEIPVRRNDDSVFYADISSSLITLEGETYFSAFFRDITERRRMEEVLRESEEKYRTILDNIEEGYYETDLAGNLTFFNDSICRIAGCSREEPLGMNNRQYTTKETAKKMFQVFNKVYKTEKPATGYDYEIIKKDGAKAYVSVSISLLKNSAGKKIGFRGITRDITERKRAEEALRESEEKYRNLVERANDGICITQDTILQYINPQLAKMIGYSVEELIGLRFIDFFIPEEIPKVADKYKRRMAGEDVAPIYETALRHRDGGRIDIEVNAGIITYKGKIANLVLVRNITERRKAEEALRESEENFRRSLDDSSLGIRIVTAEGETLYANQAVLEIYDYESIEELRKTPLKERYTPESYAEFQIRKQKRGRGEFGPSEYEISIMRKNGEIRHIQVFRKEVIWNSAKQFQIIYHDITKSKNAEDELQKSEEKYRNILESIEEGYYEVDLAGNLTFINDSMCRTIGYSREELIGMNNRVYTNKVNAKKLFQAFNEVYRTGKSGRIVNYETIRKDGTNRYLETSVSLHKDSSGKPIGFRGVVRDISEQKRAEEKLLQSETKYRSIVENAQEGIYQSTVGYLALNPALARMLGYDSPEEVMATITDIAKQLYVNPDDRKKLLDMVNEKGSVTDFETEYYKKDGSRILVSINMHAVRNDQGHILYYQGINQDITEKKKIEAERQENIERLRRSLGATINAMAVTVETRDPYTAGHQRRVADLARAIATERNLTGDQIDGIRMASMIHDIGKISIPSEILTKPTQLTDLEFNLIKTHSQSGYNILKDIDFPWPIAQIVLEHHERINGSGYPNGLKGEQILLESRILAIADVVEAISSHRPYRPAHGINVALDEISKNKGILYDPALADACLRLFQEKNYQLIT